MTLAWQMREWDLEAFEMRIQARTMHRWREWLKRRPQGQRHQDEMTALAASAVCASSGMDIKPESLIFYEPKPVEKPSQQQIDAGVDKLFALAAKRKKQETEGKKCQTSAT